MNARPHHVIDLWLVSLDNADAPTSADLDDPQDSSRCDQIVVPARRRQFAFRRKALRYVLARYLPSYSLEVADGGKPFIRTRSGRNGLHFSTSSSRDVCAVCVCSTAESGVDIEANPPTLDIAEVVNRFMPGAASQARLLSLPPGESGATAQPESFRQHLAVMSWCRLEAYTKLHGRTLHEVLFENPATQLPAAFDRSRHHLAAVANLDFVCIVAQRQPFQVARLHQIDFARIVREQA
jgi:hypothetical protein